MDTFKTLCQLISMVIPVFTRYENLLIFNFSHGTLYIIIKIMFDALTVKRLRSRR